MAKIQSPSGETEFFQTTELQQAFEKELKTGEKVSIAPGVIEASFLREATTRAEYKDAFDQFRERILNPYVPSQPPVQRFSCNNNLAYKALRWIVGANPTNSTIQYPPLLTGLNYDADTPSLRIASTLTYDGSLLSPPYGQNWGACPVQPATAQWKFPWYEQFYVESTGAPVTCWNGGLCNPNLQFDRTGVGSGCRIMSPTLADLGTSATFRGSYNALTTGLGGLTVSGSSICTTQKIGRPSNDAYTHVGWFNLSFALKNVNPSGPTATFSKYETVIQIGDADFEPFRPWADYWVSPSNLISNVPPIGNTFTNVAVITGDLFQPAYTPDGLNCNWIFQNINFTNLYP
jgi:hypothetical protein